MLVASGADEVVGESVKQRDNAIRWQRIAVLLSTTAALGLVSPTAASAASCGGTAYAPPFVTGAPSESGTAVAGSPGHRQGYVFSVKGNVPTSVFVEVKGYGKNGVEWHSLGVTGSGGRGDAPWGNALGRPALRAKSLGVNGVFVSWSC